MTPEADHLSIEVMQRLCEGLLPEIEQCFAEDHLAECDHCRGVFRRMDALLYRGFSAEAHAAAIRREAYASDPLVAALRRAATRLAPDKVGRDVVAVFQRWLDSASAVWGPGPVPLFGIRGAVAVSGADQAEPIRVVLEPGTARGRVRIAESSRPVRIEVPGGAKPQAVLLFDPESNFLPVVAGFETADGTHIAHFDGVPRGEYFLALSPF
jgi:hypothetical protein